MSEASLWVKSISAKNIFYLARKIGEDGFAGQSIGLVQDTSQPIGVMDNNDLLLGINNPHQLGAIGQVILNFILNF